MHNNIHIVMNSLSHGSRVLKETATLAKSDIDQIFIVGFHADGLKEYEEIGFRRVICRLKLSTKEWSNSIFLQVIKYIEYCFRVLHFCRSKNIQIINVHSVDLLPLGVLLKWKTGGKLVYDAHELETEKFGLEGVRKRLSKLIERRLIQKADLVIVVGKSIENWYREKYGITNIVTLLNCPEYKEPKRGRILHQCLQIPETKKIVIYQGGLERGRGIEKLLKAFISLENQRYVLVCMGYGELTAMIKEYALEYDNIYFKEAVSPDRVLEYTASADIGVSYIDNASLNDRYCLPNKLFEYVMAGLPVIVNEAPEQTRIVRDAVIGTVLGELTSYSLQQALQGIEELDRSEMRQRLREVAVNSSWDKQSELMMDAYSQYIF